MKTFRHLAVVLSSFALACGGASSGSSEPASSGGGEHEEHAEGHGHHESTGVPELDALHDELGAVWHGEDRVATACVHADSFQTRAAAVRAATPAGADAEAWASAGEALAQASDALASECAASGPAVEERLSALHDAFHTAMEIAGGGHHDAGHESGEGEAHGEHHD